MGTEHFLLMDFGTTTLKTAVVELDTGFFSHLNNYPSLPNCSAEPGRYEVSPSALTDRFLSVCDFYFNKLGLPFEGIVLCSEQNGSLLVDEHDRPVTNYISWKDERALEPVDNVSTYARILRQLGGEFKRITGSRPAPNSPLMSLVHIGLSSKLPRAVRLVALPEWLDLSSGDSTHVAHDTMLHSLSFYDVRARQVSDDLIHFVAQLTGTRCTLSTPAPTGAVSGYWHNGGRRIPIYTGVGDHQCSVLGACNQPRQSISINIGTSSQVAIVDGDQIGEESELRPYFDGRLLSAVTRIAAGRALANFVSFLDEVARTAGGEPSFWDLLGEMDSDDVASATLRFDLAMFSSTWNYRAGGTIAGIADGTLTVRNFLASLISSWVGQYVDLIRLFDPGQTATRCVLSGGLSRRLPHLATILAEMSGYRTWPACDMDESLLGLRTIALVASGRTRECLEGQNLFGRSCIIANGRTS